MLHFFTLEVHIITLSNIFFYSLKASDFDENE